MHRVVHEPSQELDDVQDEWQGAGAVARDILERSWRSLPTWEFLFEALLLHAAIASAGPLRLALGLVVVHVALNAYACLDRLACY